MRSEAYNRYVMEIDGKQGAPESYRAAVLEDEALSDTERSLLLGRLSVYQSDEDRLEATRQTEHAIRELGG